MKDSIRRKKSIWIRAVVAFALLAMGMLNAQAPADKPLPVFDVVSIKPNKSLGNIDSTSSDKTTYRATNVSLKQMLVHAFDTRDALIFGLPGWADSDRWDVNAKISDPDMAQLNAMTRDQRRGIARAMLTERFHLTMHIEMRMQPVYELTVTGGGPKFKASAPGEDPGVDTGDSDARISLKAASISMANLAQSLTPRMDRTVIDKTGLAGEYDLRLLWTTDRAPQPLPDDAPPTIFTAIEEQLGLKLVPAKGLAPVLVVDHAELPSEN